MLNKHIVRTFLLITSIFTAFATSENILNFPMYEKSWEESVLFCTRFLEKPEAVEKFITKQYGFEKSTFITPDLNLKLECLVRKVEKPTFTFIVSVGFIPGFMTGMATLIKMLPPDCNIIFYNNRGKGNSEGKLFSRLWDYGTQEYIDVIGACDYAKELNKEAPIVLYGLCAGAFSNTKALGFLHGHDALQKYNICAHIMDSPVTDIQSAIDKIPQHTCDTKTWSGWFWHKILWLLRYTAYRPCFMSSGDDACLDAKELAATNVPTLHYNCEEGDILTPYEITRNFYEEQSKNMAVKEFCQQHTFKKGGHAVNHLKEKEQYAFVLANFLNKHVGGFIQSKM